MKLLRLIKYPGSKGVIVPEIKRVFKESGKREFIDVFGGSGIVSLNIHSETTVYNEVNQQLANLFMALQKEPEALISGFEKRLTPDKSSTVSNKGISRPSYNGKEGAYRKEETAFTVSIKDALDTLVNFSTSFGGLGETYSTRREKASRSFLLRTRLDLPAIVAKVKHWKIENLDFRDLIEKYDSPNAFFYLDPPYLSKKWYADNMEITDFKELKSIIASLKGIYLMNIDVRETELTRLFGKPTFVKSSLNENGGMYREHDRYRVKQFYTNVHSK